MTIAGIFGIKRKEEGQDRLEKILKGIPIFEELTRRELLAVERILHKRQYEPEEVIFRQDEPGMGMYIVDSGKVAIISEASGVQFTELGEGEFFGELALLDEAPRSATAVAKTQSSVFGFFQPDLFGLIDRDPRLGVKIVLKLARIIGERLRKANVQIVEVKKQ